MSGKVIGITGYARHGKDTLANHLVSKYGFTRLAFADKLKRLALLIDPIVGGTAMAVSLRLTGDDVRLSELLSVVDPDDVKDYAEVRRFYQQLGTRVREVLGEETWVNALYTDMATMLSHGTNVVVSDVRFPNEVDAVKQLGGEVWRVQRINEDGSEYDNGIGKDHPSEALVPTLLASKAIIAVTMEDIYNAVDAIMGVPVA